MKNVFKILNTVFITGISFFLFSVSYAQTSTDIDDAFWVSEARSEEEFLKKLDAIKNNLVTKGIIAIACQQFDNINGVSVNCDPAVLTDIQEKIDREGSLSVVGRDGVVFKRYRVVNLSQASLPPLDEESVLKLRKIRRNVPRALRFPAGFPVYSVIDGSLFILHRDYKKYNFLPSQCYPNAELVSNKGYHGKAVIPTADNIFSFAKYLHTKAADSVNIHTCTRYKVDHAVKYKTEYLLYDTRWELPSTGGYIEEVLPIVPDDI